jgi:hemolysin activation/secretion protein
MNLHAIRLRWRAPALLLTLAGAAGPWVHAQQAAESEPKASTAKSEEAFDVLEYRVLGNTVLAPREIEGRLYPLLGTHKTLTDLETARKALEDLYHDRGYGTAFVDIPPQTVRGGVVRLHVTEGTLESRKVAGARYFAERDVVAKLPASAPGNVLQLSKLQEELTAVNRETPDRQVVPVLKAGSVPGTVDLALTVNDTLPLHGSLEFNNQATLDTHELRGVASLSYDDLFGRLDSLALQYQFTPQDFSQVRVFALNYAVHPFENGLQPSISYINSNSNVPTAGTLGVLGIGEITSAKLAYPVQVTADSQQSVSLGVDYKHFRNTISQNATTALQTPISYVNLSAGYALAWHTDWQATTFTVTGNGGGPPRAGHLAGFRQRSFPRPSELFRRAPRSHDDLASSGRLRPAPARRRPGRHRAANRERGLLARRHRRRARLSRGGGARRRRYQGDCANHFPALEARRLDHRGRLHLLRRGPGPGVRRTLRAALGD